MTCLIQLRILILVLVSDFLAVLVTKNPEEYSMVQVTKIRLFETIRYLVEVQSEIWKGLNFFDETKSLYATM